MHMSLRHSLRRTNIAPIQPRKARKAQQTQALHHLNFQQLDHTRHPGRPEAHYVKAARGFTALFAVLMIVVAGGFAYAKVNNPDVRIIPVVLGIAGFILGPMMEENLRRALLLSRGDWSTFVTRPLSSALLIAAALMIVVVMLPTIKKKREVAFAPEE